MSPVSPIPVVFAVLTALLTTFIIMKRFGAPPLQGRFASIDGLRGYLAFFVYIHHSCIWYFYLQSGKWAVPPSAMYTHFGQKSVDIFFMITGFLFFSKILNGKSKPVDWLNLYVSRFLRLVPLYLFAITMLLIIVAYLSDWKINEPAPKLVGNIIRWLAFTISGAPDINGIYSTSIIIARVTWSLPFEWYFYFLLPIFALIANIRPPITYIFLSFLCILFLTTSKIEYNYLLIFFGGIVASFLSRTENFCNIAVKWPSSVVVIVCIGIAVFGSFHSAYKVIPLILLTVAFSLVASGNSLFGILTSAISRS